MKRFESGYSRDEVTGEVSINPPKALTERKFPEIGRMYGEAQLLEALAAATVLYREHGDKGRSGINHAVRAVLVYLKARGFPMYSLDPLNAVNAALIDADNGVQNLTFSPDRNESGGRPKKPQEATTWDSVLIAVADFCVKHHKMTGERPYLGPGYKTASKLIREIRGIKVSPSHLKTLREKAQQGPEIAFDAILIRKYQDAEFMNQHPLQSACWLLLHPAYAPPPK